VKESTKSKKLLATEIDWKALSQVMLCARSADEREAILFRQGRGYFQLPSAGHELMAVLGAALNDEDVIFPYYRDRALLMARGVSLEALALDYFAKKDSSSQGRQMSSHFFAPEKNIMSVATPTGLQFLPAAGAAWAKKMAASKDIVVCSTGEATVRQGEFFESLAFALQEILPLLFVVEDNGYGVSTCTKDLTPLALKMLPEHCLSIEDRYDPLAFLEHIQHIIADIRQGNGPHILWLKCDRLMSHTSSDDQRLYRSAGEIRQMQLRDPLLKLKTHLIEQGIETEEQFHFRYQSIKEEVKTIYQQAYAADEPCLQLAKQQQFMHAEIKHHAHAFHQNKPYTMVSALNECLHDIFETVPDAVYFGEDVADPKGGVFGMTKGLSTAHPSRVFNSPLAEATIAGLASGLALQGKRPIIELQFVDFIGPAYNQIANQIATLFWRSGGKSPCPCVILAPCGGYINGAGPWHSQSGEGLLAHIPGLKLLMPSQAQSAADCLLSAIHDPDPVMILLPKKQFFNPYTPQPQDAKLRSLYLPHIAHQQRGDDVTIVTWGNGSELATNLLNKRNDLSADLFSIESLVPFDLETIRRSVKKTGRLLIVQEDNEICSFGEHIIAKLLLDADVMDSLFTPPQLVTRANLHVPFNPHLAAAILPNEDTLNSAISNLMEA